MAFWLAIPLGPLLWLMGAIFFDYVHFVLHVMLRSQWRPLRAIAGPHLVHHEWIDRKLEVQWEYQRRNIGCHLVLEYVTQLVFTAAVALLLPLPFAIVLATLQTLVFAATLRYGGLDLNHKPIAMLDAYCPGSFTPLAPPTYHALHHVYPDAYYSAYTKLIDILVAGGAQLRGRRAVIQRAQSPLGRALGEVLREQGVTVIESDDALDESVFRETDVLLLCDPETDEIPILESFIDATQARQLPPEAWVVHSRSENPTARHYVDDIRINYRTLVVPDADGLSASRADEAARRAVSQIRRGFHYVSSTAFSERLWGHLRFHATQPIPPQQARLVRHRSELLTTS